MCGGTLSRGGRTPRTSAVRTPGWTTSGWTCRSCRTAGRGKKQRAKGKRHIPSLLVVERVTAQRKPPEVRMCRLSIQSRVGTRPPSRSYTRPLATRRCAARAPAQGSTPAAAARPVIPAGRAHPPGGSASSDGLLERVAREEAHDPPGGNGGRGARLRVAADARPLGAHLPRTKAAQEHGFPLL